MSDGIIPTALDKLLSIINNEHLTNGFDTDNLKSKGKKDIVVSLADVNDHILKAKQELIAEIKKEINGEHTVLPEPICPYPKCGGRVREREDGEYHCRKCSSEINDYYCIIEGVKLKLLGTDRQEGKR